MAEHGGYRKPAHPAGVSGPGRMSRRTDGGPAQAAQKMTGGSYGDTQAMDQLQQAAPLGATAPATATQPRPLDTSSVTPLNAPTAQPGVGLLDNLGQFQAQQASPIDDQTRARMLAYLPELLRLASQPQASEATRMFVRQLRSDL